MSHAEPTAIEPLPPPATALSRRLCGIVCAIVACSALVMLGIAIFVPARPGLAMIGFEVVVLVAAGMGLAFARGASQGGPGLALFCLGGCILLCSTLGIFDMRGNLDRRLLLAAAALRVGSGLLLWALAAWEVLRRDRRSWGTLAKGVALTALVVATIAGIVAARNTWLVQGATGALEIVRITGGLILGLVLMIVLSAGVHLCIKAFQFGVAAPADRPAPAPSA